MHISHTLRARLSLTHIPPLPPPAAAHASLPCPSALGVCLSPVHTVSGHTPGAWDAFRLTCQRVSSGFKVHSSAAGAGASLPSRTCSGPPLSLGGSAAAQIKGSLRMSSSRRGCGALGPHRAGRGGKGGVNSHPPSPSSPVASPTPLSRWEDSVPSPVCPPPLCPRWAPSASLSS